MINHPERETPVEEMMGWANEVDDSHASLTIEVLAIEDALSNDKPLNLENVKYARSYIQEFYANLQLLDEALAKLQKPDLTIVGKD